MASWQAENHESEANFSGLRVAAFESRRSEDMARLIKRHSGRPFVSPSMREVPLDNVSAVVDFAKHLITGQIDVVIFTTGVGLRQFVAIVERHMKKSRVLSGLADIVTIARGPKPTAVMKELGLTPTHRVPEPNTWREILALVDKTLSIANLRIGLQEYGKMNPSLIAGLEARGAHVWNLKVYDWDLPEDTHLLCENVEALAESEREVVLFTSAQQVVHLFLIADQLGKVNALRNGLRNAVVASIGPTTSEMLREYRVNVDLAPEHSKMGQLVAAAAGQSKMLLDRKQHLSSVLSGSAQHVLDPKAPWYDSPFMKACRGEVCDVTPVWLMRQAGRYMPEYREVRAKTNFLELCKSPDLCAEVMVTAVNRLGVDAAIIFSDLLPILEPMGLDLEYAHGEGPVIHNPIRESADADRLVELEHVDALHFVTQTVRLTRAELPEDIPLIGFAGAPFTLASYAIEGGASRNYLHTKTLMYRDEGAWQAIIGRLARAVTVYLNAQIASGAQCVQLFDSWVGCLGPDDYRRYVLPFVRQIVEAITPGVPVIHFATGNPALLPLMAEAGSTVVGIDWRIRLADAWKVVGYDRAVQGNLDPTVLLADQHEIRLQAKEILDQVGGRPGHIFNLGHGVLPQTPVDNVVALVDAVHELSAR